MSEETTMIEKGASILNTYRVESDAIQGGMGKVWRVHHTGWNVDLAMKQPKAQYFQNEKQKADFIGECEAWINLGLHPQIVSCYYVREIGGVPSIFSEWMDGGSLKNWIESGRLYEGGVDAALERVLDIAIQFARGLHYAHEHRDKSGKPLGLIHQDVKPDNLLLTNEGDAKVADFGIARARAVLTMKDNGRPAPTSGDADTEPDAAMASASGSYTPADATMVSGSGAYTPAYCSPEQAEGIELSRRTDIYSWAVSVLEMFLGERKWNNGTVVSDAFDDYLFMQMRLSLPDGLPELLRRCLNEEPDDRPHDFAEIDEELLAIYQTVTGAAYPRPLSKAAANTADSLNNRALSFLDLGKPEEAIDLFHSALKKDPNHAETQYNLLLYEWRKGFKNKGAVFDRMNIVVENQHSWRSVYMLGLLYLECGDTDMAKKMLKQALDDSGGDVSIAAVIEKTQDIRPRLLTTFPVEIMEKALFSDSGRHILIAEKMPEQQQEIPKLRLSLVDSTTGEVIGMPFWPRNIAIRGMKITDDEKTVVIWSDWSDRRTHLYYNMDTGEPTDLTIDDLAFSDRLWNREQSQDGAYCVEYTWDYHTNESKTYYTAVIFDNRTGANIQNLSRIDNSLLKCGNITEEGLLRVAFYDDENKMVQIYDYDFSSMHHNAEGMLCRILSLKDAGKESDRLSMLCMDIVDAERQGDIPGALALMEQAREIPGYMNAPAFFETSRKVGRSSVAGKVINHLPVNVKLTYPSGEEYRWGAPKNPSIVWWGDTVAFRDYDGFLFLFDVRKRELEQRPCLIKINGPVCLDPSGRRMLAAKRSTAMLIDVDTGKILSKFHGHTGEITLVCMNENNLAATSASDHTIRIWNCKNGKCIAIHENIPLLATKMRLSPDGKFLVYQTRENDTRILKTSGHKKTVAAYFKRRPGFEGIAFPPSIRQFEFSPDGFYVIGSKYIWYVENPGQQRYEFDVSGQLLSCFGPDGTKAFFAGGGYLNIFRLSDGQLLYRSVAEDYKNMCVSPDGSMLAMCGWDDNLQIWLLDWEYNFPPERA